MDTEEITLGQYEQLHSKKYANDVRIIMVPYTSITGCVFEADLYLTVPPGTVSFWGNWVEGDFYVNYEFITRNKTAISLLKGNWIITSGYHLDALDKQRVLLGLVLEAG